VLEVFTQGVRLGQLDRPINGISKSGAVQVMRQLMGEAPLPWETRVGVLRDINAFEVPVMRLLHRNPARRASLQTFQDECSAVLAALLDGF
jgi:hypothetical protein